MPRKNLKKPVLKDLGEDRVKDWGLDKRPHLKDLSYEDLRDIHLAFSEAVSDGDIPDDPPPPYTCGACTWSCTK
jgi:hypothetical protein